MAKNSKPGKQLSMSDFCSEISDDLAIDKDIVAEVVNRALDIWVEQLFKNGYLKIPRICSIKAHKMNFKSVAKGSEGQIFSRDTLRAKISYGIRNAWTLVNYTDVGKVITVTRDNWDAIVKYANENCYKPNGGGLPSIIDFLTKNNHKQN